MQIAPNEMSDDDSQPAPELLAEAKGFTDEIASLLDLGGADRESLRFTVTVPKEFAVLAAWVMFKEDMRRDGVPTVLPRPIQLHLGDGGRSRDWQRAKAYFQRAIFESFDTDYVNLLMGTHPALFPLPPPLPPGAPSSDLDDDIPF